MVKPHQIRFLLDILDGIKTTKKEIDQNFWLVSNISVEEIMKKELKNQNEYWRKRIEKFWGQISIMDYFS